MSEMNVVTVTRLQKRGMLDDCLSIPMGINVLLETFCYQSGRKVICGTQTETLLLYCGDSSRIAGDRFVDLSPNSVDALLKPGRHRTQNNSADCRAFRISYRPSWYECNA
ncbi:hypothetical protein ACH5RR_013516 [Cinchona calisaya]|uniref:Uncharacterized protein n=1 Tax=Cinchona calisaya TaxID=153742 RepID=A0ABD3A0C6_9GENT